VEEASSGVGVLAGEFGGTAGGVQDEEALSRMGPKGKLSELSESANPSIWEVGGEEAASGSCLDCKECEECGGTTQGRSPGGCSHLSEDQMRLKWLLGRAFPWLSSLSQHYDGPWGEGERRKRSQMVEEELEKNLVA
jgi:hypothetical protein